jgi:hypothetical protein
MVKIFGLTKQNKQPEPPKRKPNEDNYKYVSDEKNLVAMVVDGIPVLRDDGGNYPPDNGAVASKIAVNAIPDLLNWGKPNQKTLEDIFCFINLRIGYENRKRGNYQKTPPFWMATVGCILWADILERRAFFAYIGDPLAFVISPNMRIKIITEDQLRFFESHLYACHSDQFKDPGTTTFIREHQDENVRNVLHAKCFCKKNLCGWGALTGQGSAMSFVKTCSFATPPGTRVIMASDAIEAIGAGNTKERKPKDYKAVFQSIKNLSPEKAVKELLRLTRLSEKEKQCKSDDATFVVVDF